MQFCFSNLPMYYTFGLQAMESAGIPWEGDVHSKVVILACDTAQVQFYWLHSVATHYVIFWLSGRKYPGIHYGCRKCLAS